MAQGTKVVTKGLGSLGEGIPIIGGIIKGASEAAQAAADLAAAAAKMANDFLSAELKKTTGALKDLSAQGTSFAGGMTEMRNTANGAGMNLVMFTNVMKNSRESIIGMGMSSTEAAQVLGTNLKSLATQSGKSGMSLRNEMLAMGYSYEEQGAVMAQYMAGMKQAGKLESMSKEEIAAGTRAYAKDLKVLADLTGKDAKKAMEEAQKASMKADIMAQLSPEEADKFQKAYASMPDYAKKGFLEYVSSGGTAITDQATNIAMSQNKEVEKLIKGSYDTIKDSSKTASDAQRETLEQTARAGEEGRKLSREGNAAINQAATLGASGLQGLADFNNQVVASGMYSADAVGKSGEAAEKQATAADATTKGFVNATEAATNFSIKVEELATQALPKYSELLGKAMQGMVDMLRKAGVNIAETAEEATARKSAEDAAALKAEEMRYQQGVNSSLTNEMGMDFGQLSGSGGGIFEGPDTGFPVLLHGTEAVIPMEELSGAKKSGTMSDILQSQLQSAGVLLGKGSLGIGNLSEQTTGFDTASADLIAGQYEAIKANISKMEEEGKNEDIKQMILSNSSLMEELRNNLKASFAGEGGSTAQDSQQQMLALMEKFVSKTEEMERHLYDQKNLQQRLLDLGM
jgi:hypothetical protein